MSKFLTGSLCTRVGQGLRVQASTESERDSHAVSQVISQERVLVTHAHMLGHERSGRGAGREWA